ncbi:hypothetical protein GCM10027176_45750 [Actinoallomurus bryophytorum]|uniref:Uncharacterized protein n=1 Tax=Actinoallomurus bryophytorum TaxID=1490222 RepID=A0A543CCH4_9ACTN|nr:hypothetical protein [Actinoallomurus bryophytorum]TQL94774.1 hypothetical protein FB559_0256 [Actinoallomurus bryophytorum]
MIANSGPGGREPMTPEEFTHAMQMLRHEPVRHDPDDLEPDDEDDEDAGQ